MQKRHEIPAGNNCSAGYSRAPRQLQYLIAVDYQMKASRRVEVFVDANGGRGKGRRWNDLYDSGAAKNAFTEARPKRGTEQGKNVGN